MPDVMRRADTVRPRRQRSVVMGARLARRSPSLNVEIDTEELDWTTGAACLDADPELWFADEHDQYADEPEARRVCVQLCAVREQCLAYATDRDLYGIWGGTDRSERNALRKALRKART